MMIRASTVSRRRGDALFGRAAAAACPRSRTAWSRRRRSAPRPPWRCLAMIGEAPVPVPPPMPAVMKIMSAPRTISPSVSALSSAARSPISGRPPAPRPLVSLSPMRTASGASLRQQRLGVGVDRDELDPVDAGLDHAVDGVAAGAADADDLDPGKGDWRAQHRRVLPARSTRHRFGSIRAGGHRLTTLAPSDDRSICNAVDPNTLTPARSLSSGLLHRSSHPAPLWWATPG